MAVAVVRVSFTLAVVGRADAGEGQYPDEAQNQSER
jgi:hypothetical protein